MPDYRRWWVKGGTFFFTVVTYDRMPILCTPLARRLLKSAYAQTSERHRFEDLAMVLLPDHLHAVWRLPDGDTAYDRRWSMLKSCFTRAWLLEGGEERPTSASQAGRGRRGVWQRNYWAHWIEDQDDLARHLDYLHYNPVHHGLVDCPHQWRFSTFGRCVREGLYEPRWGCACDGRERAAPDFTGLPLDQME